MIRRIPRAAALVGAVALGLTACGEASGPGSTPGPTSTTTTPAETTGPDETASAPSTSEDEMESAKPVPVPTSAVPELPTGRVPEAVLERADVQAAVADYAERMDVPVDEVEVAGFAEVTWNDGSIGCPEPGMMYTQALVPGYQLVLRVDDTLASYHAAKGKDFFYCAKPRPPIGGDTTS